MNSMLMYKLYNYLTLKSKYGKSHVHFRHLDFYMRQKLSLNPKLQIINIMILTHFN